LVGRYKNKKMADCHLFCFIKPACRKSENSAVALFKCFALVEAYKSRPNAGQGLSWFKALNAIATGFQKAM
jgi:hypothetical protein